MAEHLGGHVEHVLGQEVAAAPQQGDDWPAAIRPRVARLAPRVSGGEVGHAPGRRGRGGRDQAHGVVGHGGHEHVVGQGLQGPAAPTQDQLGGRRCTPMRRAISVSSP